MSDKQGNMSNDGAQSRFTSIVVPIDGSPASERALEYAAQLNAKRILLLRVEVDEPTGDIDPTDPYERWRHDHVSKVASDLDALASQHASAADTVETRIRYGNPADEIMAEAHDHELIVMSATGKGAAGRLLFGSVADRVMRYSAVPTLVVRAGAAGIALQAPARIVVPLDGSELAERALPVAVRMAQVLSLPLRLVRCVGMDEVLQTIREARRRGDTSMFEASFEPYEVGHERADAEAMEYLQAVRERIAAPGQETTCDRLSGSASFEVLWALKEDDLVVMTSRGQGGVRRWMLGSVSEKLVREAKAPVLLVPVGRAGTTAE